MKDQFLEVIILIGTALFIAFFIMVGLEFQFNSDACFINGYANVQWIDHGAFFNTRDQIVMCYNLDGTTMLLDFSDD